MPVLYQKMIFRVDLKKNPDVIYVFGDNDVRLGFGGQAKEMRGEKNAVGVRTKLKPSQDHDAYWSDRNFIQNCAKIDQDVEPLKAHLRRGGIVVIPMDGIGTGLSRMEETCPRSFTYLNTVLTNLSNVPKTI